MYLALGVTAQHAVEVAHIVAVHGDDEVVVGVVMPCHLSRSVSLAGDAVLCQFLSGGRIDGVANSVPNFFV